MSPAPNDPRSPAFRLPSPAVLECDRLVDAFLAEHGPGTVSVWCAGLDGAASYTRHHLAGHYAASTVKLPLLVAAYRRHDRGELNLDDHVVVHNRFASAASGSYGLDPANDQDPETWGRLGHRARLRDLATRAITVSGNLATNLLLEHVGLAEVAAVLREAGCSPRCTVRRGIEDAAARQAGIDNRVTALDLGLVMLAVANGTIADPTTCRQVERVLAAQRYRDKIPAGLPDGVRVANKTGWVDGVAHDVALIRPHEGAAFVLSVCTTVDVPDDVASALVTAVARTIWEGRCP